MLTTELANKVGVTPETVRFYTRKGLLSASRNAQNGYRIYQQDALKRLRFIIHAKHIGFSLAQIQEIMDLSTQSSMPCPRVKRMLQEKIAQTKQKIANYQHHLALMEQTYADWENQQNNQENEASICTLIENWKAQPMQLKSKE